MATAQAMYAIKAHVEDPSARSWTFARQKTMYGGKKVSPGDTIFVFASENEGGPGLVARGIVTSVEAVPKSPAPERQTPRVTITVTRVASARRELGRKALRSFDGWGDGRPETELNFKFYRQATNKLVGLSASTCAYLECFFDA